MLRTARVLAGSLLAMLFVRSVVAQEELYQAQGQPFDNMATSVASAGDVNQDGTPDVIVGVPGCTSFGGSSGFALVFSGADGSTLHRFELANIDQFGKSVDGVGDMNQDGYDDVAVGAPGDQLAFVFSGRTGGFLQFLSGGLDFGRYVMGPGDLDGDTIPDVMVGNVCCGPTFSPQIVAYSGADSTVIGTISDPELFDRMDFVGDVNGDQIGDFLTARTDGFDVDLRSGADFSILRCHPGLIFGPGAALGQEFAGCGDVNGDAVPDYIISGRPKRVWVYCGASGALLHQFDASQAGENFGYSVGGAGDANGDGYDDFLIASQDPFDLPFVRLHSGVTGNALYTFSVPVAGSQFGKTIAGLGDLTGDGSSEFILGTAGGNCTSVTGAYTVRTGDDLFLDVFPDIVPVGSSLTLSIGEGTPGLPAILLLVEVNGVPTIANAGTLLFDGAGSVTQTASVPIELAGLTLTFSALAQSSAGPFIQTSNEVLTIP